MIKLLFRASHTYKTIIDVRKLKFLINNIYNRLEMKLKTLSTSNV